MDFSKLNPMIVGGVILAVVLIIVLIGVFTSSFKSPFKSTLITPMDQLDNSQPKSFPSLNETQLNPEEHIKLEPPVVPEEIGLAMVYPQGSGVGMSKSDSNSFTDSNPGPLLTEYTQPQSYGESNIIQPVYAAQGSRIIKIKDTGNQMVYKPVDESMKSTFAGAYNAGDVQDGSTLINGTQQVNYNDVPFDPEQNLKLQSSPGQMSTLPNCETTYPNVVKYNDMCITDGDIPYGKVVDNKVNPRLVSRWESYTGDYSRENALQPIDGLLYPNLNVQM